jgi:hypothetical protein
MSILEFRYCDAENPYHKRLKGTGIVMKKKEFNSNESIVREAHAWNSIADLHRGLTSVIAYPTWAIWLGRVLLKSS